MVIMYADKVTQSMKRAIDETNRRRKIQQAHNRKHNITPETIQKEITQIFDFGNDQKSKILKKVSETLAAYTSMDALETALTSMEKEMHAAAKDLEFERAADLRDQINELKKLIVIEA